MNCLCLLLCRVYYIHTVAGCVNNLNQKMNYVRMYTYNTFYILFLRVGAFFFIVMNLIFGNLTSVELFIKDKVIFK